MTKFTTTAAARSFPSPDHAITTRVSRIHNMATWPRIIRSWNSALWLRNRNRNYLTRGEKKNIKIKWSETIVQIGWEFFETENGDAPIWNLLEGDRTSSYAPFRCSDSSDGCAPFLRFSSLAANICKSLRKVVGYEREKKKENLHLLENYDVTTFFKFTIIQFFSWYFNHSLIHTLSRGIMRLGKT